MPSEIQGDVTVGGKSPAGRPGVLHVVAAYQAAKFLQPYLSLETTADSEGHFVLSGLTSGDYVVQASLDNIWLSPAVPFHMGTAKPPSFQLAIALPGAPLYLKLRDGSGKPLPGAKVTVERNGPMADLWPTSWTAGGKGLVFIPTLETGWQTIRIPGQAKVVRVKIPPAPAAPRTLSRYGSKAGSGSSQ
jgi:hypothetical protein